MGGVNAQVGIGTTSPSNDLDVEGSGAAATAIDINNTSTGDPTINLQISGTTTFSVGIDNSDADKFKIGTSAPEINTRFTIDASGNCGIGTTSPAGKFEVYSATQNVKLVNITDGTSWMALVAEVNNDGWNSLSVNGDMALIFSTDNLDAADSKGLVIGPACSADRGIKIMEDGKVGIGTSSPGYFLDVNGTVGANGYTAFTNYSDSRLKTNITNLDTGALSKIMQLRPVSFQYNKKYLQLYAGSDLQKVHKGFIAQEIRQVFPEMVSEMKASADSVQYLDLNVSHLQVYLVKAIQEQQVIIQAQKKEIDAQKAEAMLQKAETTQKLTDLESKMNTMLLLLNKKEEVTAKQ
jgi:hypothetical protein